MLLTISYVKVFVRHSFRLPASEREMLQLVGIKSVCHQQLIAQPSMPVAEHFAVQHLAYGPLTLLAMWHGE